MSNKPTTINNKPIARNQCCGRLSIEDGDGTTRVPANIAGLGGGKSRGFGFDRADRTPERIAKAQAFWVKRQQDRKNPANCQRCGKPLDTDKKSCQKCLDYQAKYRGKKSDKNEKLTAGQVVAMVKQMRREMDKMQTRFKVWQKAVNYRASLKYRTNALRKKYHKPVSHAEAMDYLADSNHAYQNDDAQAA
jgi:hypothetical protein